MKPQWLMTATWSRSGASRMRARKVAQRAARLGQLSIAPPHHTSSRPVKSRSGHSRARSTGAEPWSHEKAQRSRTVASMVIGSPSSAARMAAVCRVRRYGLAISLHSGSRPSCSAARRACSTPRAVSGGSGRPISMRLAEKCSFQTEFGVADQQRHAGARSTQRSAAAPDGRGLASMVAGSNANGPSGRCAGLVDMRPIARQVSAPEIATFVFAPCRLYEEGYPAVWRDPFRISNPVTVPAGGR